MDFFGVRKMEEGKRAGMKAGVECVRREEYKCE